MNILVTGGAGYLGSVMCEHLLAEGHDVVVLDNLLYSQNSLLHFCSNPKFSFVRGDARDEKTVARLLKTVDAIIPLAAIVGAPACDSNPWAATSTNLGAIQLLNRLRSRQQIVVYPVTNSGYGTKSGDVFCTEDTPLEPISLYGIDKVKAEEELLGTPNAVTLRLATVFGASPRMRLDLLVNHFVYAAVTDGYIVLFEKDFKRNFVHIRDVADGFIFALNNVEKLAGRPYNLGLDAANMSKWELAKKVKEHVPEFVITVSELRSDPDKRNYIVSNERLRQAGYEATRSLDAGIVELLKAYAMLPRSPYKNI